MFRPTARIVGLAVLKPLVRLIAIGQIVALASVKRTAFVESPNQSTASGSIATWEAGPMIAVS